MVVTLCLYNGLITSIEVVNNLRKENSLSKFKMAETALNRWMKARSTERIELTLEKDGISGTLFIPSGKGPFPGKYVEIVLYS